MRCKKIQELLKSDYFDGETGLRDQRLIKGHLDQCGKCRKLEEELRAQRALFRKVKLQNAPEGLWRDIREAIVREQLERGNNVRPGVLSRLKELLIGRRPGFALASAFTLILCIVVFSGIFMRNKKLSGQEDLVEGIASEYSLEIGNNSLVYDLGTNVERYFF